MTTFQISSLPVELVHFVLVLVFSLIIGLSQRHLHQTEDENKLFGADRTFTFIGLLGFILLHADKQNKYLFITGAIVLTIFLSVYYINKIRTLGDFGITSILTALLTYCLPLILLTQPFWIFILILVTILVFTELKSLFYQLSTKFDKYEFITLSKFIVMAGLILPILPNTPVIEGLPISPFKIWLAVVVISSISYISYLLKKFVFNNGGILISGILGGIYSSTATSIVIAKKLKESSGSNSYLYYSALALATTMMYLRVLLLIFIFNQQLFVFAIPYFLLMALCGALIALFYYFKAKKVSGEFEKIIIEDKNPLEFKVALFFTIIFIGISFITQWAIGNYGQSGLNVFSFLVGIIDVDPFLISLFQGKMAITMHFVLIASFQAMISNNLAKMVYSITIAGKRHAKNIALIFGIIVAVNAVAILIISFLK
jgi:uncharacterized membrane protein (DUF4010 family)